MSFSEIKFQDFITLQRGFDLPVTKMTEGDVPVLGSNSIVGYHNEAKVEPPGVVTGRSGTLGMVQFTDKPYWPHNTSLWVKDFKGNDPKFVFYKLQTLKLDRFNGGASVPTLNRNVLDTLKISIPGINEQRKIASLLFAYDFLIENNRRRIQLLEQSARLLYREWFVHLRFPGHEHVRIIDGVPEGWEKKQLVNIANLVMGQSPKSEFYNEEGEGLPFHQGVTNFGDRFVNHEFYCTVKNRLANPGDILCSVRAPVGRLNVTIDKIVIGRGLAAINSKANHQSFLYYQLKNHFFKEDMIGGGAIFASVTKNDMENQELMYPPEGLVKNFEEISVPIDNQIKTLHIQNERLNSARNILLPRLMNGEIAV